MKKKFRIYWGTAVTRFFMILWSLFILIPLYIMFLTSVKTSTEFYAGIWTLPENIFANIAENFPNAWVEASLGTGYWNTLIITAGALALTLILSSMMAYELARRRIRFKEPLSNFYLLMLLIPSMVALTPTFFIGRALGLYNKRIALVLFYTAHELPFIVYTMRSFFATLPHELEEAAFVDGATSFQTFLQIMLPIMRPGFVTAGIFALLDFWGEYMFALQLIVKKELLPAGVTILRFQSGTGVRQNWGYTYAACVMFVLPILIIYAVFQKKLMGGMTAGSVKG